MLPYLEQHYTPEQIRELMPVLTFEEIRVVEQYIHDHRETVLEQDRQIRERSAARWRPGDEERQQQERQERLERSRGKLCRAKF